MPSIYFHITKTGDCRIGLIDYANCVNVDHFPLPNKEQPAGSIF